MLQERGWKFDKFTIVIMFHNLLPYYKVVMSLFCPLFYYMLHFTLVSMGIFHILTGSCRLCFIDHVGSYIVKWCFFLFYSANYLVCLCLWKTVRSNKGWRLQFTTWFTITIFVLGLHPSWESGGYQLQIPSYHALSIICQHKSFRITRNT